MKVKKNKLVNILMKSLVPIFTFLLTIFLSPLILGYVCSIKKSINVSGRIIHSKTLRPIQNAKILINGNLSTKTDIDGTFNFHFDTTKPRFGNYLCETCENETLIDLKIQELEGGSICSFQIFISNQALKSNKSSDHRIYFPTKNCFQ